jgi:leucyl-tRNA synthetase
MESIIVNANWNESGVAEFLRQLQSMYTVVRCTSFTFSDVDGGEEETRYNAVSVVYRDGNWKYAEYVRGADKYSHDVRSRTFFREVLHEFHDLDSAIKCFNNQIREMEHSYVSSINAGSYMQNFL